jgi:hypothetical protein
MRGLKLGGFVVLVSISGCSSMRAPKQPGQSAVAPVTANPPASATAAIKPPAATLDLKSLEQRLRDTRAIGVFTKLSLKNQVDDLLGESRLLYQGPNKRPPAQLRQRYDQLLLKVLGLLQEGDPQLAAAIALPTSSLSNSEPSLRFSAAE